MREIYKWSPDQLERKAKVEAGYTVVANQRRGKDTALIHWAKENGKAVRIDRQTEWGNPFHIGAHGTRERVCFMYASRHLPSKDRLLRRLSKQELAGKVLVCWCYPEQCHGDELARVQNMLVEETRNAS